MDSLLVALTPLFTQGNLAVIISMLGNAGIGWAFINLQRESREDRKQFSEALDRNSEALTDLRVTVAQMGSR